MGDSVVSTSLTIFSNWPFLDTATGVDGVLGGGGDGDVEVGVGEDLDWSHSRQRLTNRQEPGMRK